MLREMCKEKEEYRGQIEDLRAASRKEQQQQLALSSDVKELQQKLTSLTAVHRECMLMSGEEILILRVVS